MCTEYRPHTDKTGDTYCEYTIKSKDPNNSDGYAVGDVICILCGPNQTTCKTITTFYRWPITYTFERNTGREKICGSCSSGNYYEEGHDGGSSRVKSKKKQKGKVAKKKVAKKKVAKKKVAKKKVAKKKVAKKKVAKKKVAKKKVAKKKE